MHGVRSPPVHLNCGISLRFAAVCLSFHCNFSCFPRMKHFLCPGHGLPQRFHALMHTNKLLFHLLKFWYGAVFPDFSCMPSSFYSNICGLELRFHPPYTHLIPTHSWTPLKRLFKYAASSRFDGALEHAPRKPRNILVIVNVQPPTCRFEPHSQLIWFCPGGRIHKMRKWLSGKVKWQSC